MRSLIRGYSWAGKEGKRDECHGQSESICITAGEYAGQRNCGGRPVHGGIAARRFVRNPYAMVSLFVLLMFIIVSFCAPLITPYDPAKIDFSSTNLPPFSEGHLLGTDELGRDIFTRLLYSGQVSADRRLLCCDGHGYHRHDHRSALRLFRRMG